MQLIQQIGSYAGFAAVIGLAVLSALYFSQARDLRRLREWAGRAADRPPAPRSAPSRGSDRAFDREARESSRASASSEAVASQATMAQPPRGSRGAQGAAVLSGVAGASGGGRGATALQSSPASERPSISRSAPAAASGTASPNARAAPGGAARGRGQRARGTRYLALAAAGAVVLIVAAAFAVSLIGGAEQPTSGEGAGTLGQAPRQSAAAPSAPSSVTFSVLNGAGVDGLGKQVADTLESAGYRRGNVTNASQPTAESAILFAPGARADARAVGQQVGVSRLEPLDVGSRALAGDARVVVVVGADQAQ